ncbi:MAG: hypothetical protein UHU19_00005, partial [Lachnospiraceae bacterium]|nr:hypothetical protein [Lachnospiraceae bacterium]
EATLPLFGKIPTSAPEKAQVINDFIAKLIDIKKIKSNISQELYDKIVSEWLSELKKYDKDNLSTASNDDNLLF